MIRTEVVRNGLQKLGAQTVHKAFGGYLPILRAATQAQSMGPLTVGFKHFFDTHFAVAGSTTKWPYYVPFGAAGDLSGRFFNRNVAGSYAPSSIRPVNPLRRMTSIDATPAGVTFELMDDHADIAAELLKGDTVPGASLAAYLYRDFAMAPGSSPSDLYRHFKLEFGFAFVGSRKRFEDVFHDDTDDLGLAVFEPAEAANG